MLNNVVILNHLGYWYRVYGDGAKVLSFLTNYKLFEDIRSGLPSCAFREEYIDKVISILSDYQVNHMIKYDGDDKLVNYGTLNNFKRFLHEDLPYSYVVSNKKASNIRGTFKVMYEGEDVLEFTIGSNIDKNSELVLKVVNAKVGDIIKINDYSIKIVDKNIVEE